MLKTSNPSDVIVIGAGMAGIAAAAKMQAAGRRVCVLEKSHSVGGRMATRDKPEGCWDHGAQYFTASTPEFSTQVQAWAEMGVVSAWKAPIAAWDGNQLSASRSRARYLGTPRMKSPLLEMAEGLDIVCDALVTQIMRRANTWVVEAANRVWCAEQLIIALPAPQARALLPRETAAYALADSVAMDPCLALMVQAEQPLGLPFAAVFINEGLLSWMAHNNRKPGRGVGEHYVLHASAEWSRAHVDVAPALVEAAMLEELNRLLLQWLPGQPLPRIFARYYHRWRFARRAQSSPATNAPALWPQLGLALAGDWLGDGRVEAAYCSGLAAAAGLLHEATVNG